MQLCATARAGANDAYMYSRKFCKCESICSHAALFIAATLYVDVFTLYELQ